MTRLEFNIELTPVPALRPRVTRNGTYTPAKYARFKSDFRRLALIHAPKAKLEGPLRLWLDFIITPPRSVKSTKRPYPCIKPDLDNFIKAVKDSMDDFWIDDSQVCEIHARKVYSWVDRKPKIYVLLEGISA